MRLSPPFSVLVQNSIDLLRANAPADGRPYFGCFSGGKDSCCIKRLAELAGVPVEWHYNVIIDPPELMRFIKQHHPDVEWHYRVGKRGKYAGQKQPFFRRVKQKLLVPTRWRRWCCQEYKHLMGPRGCTRILGVRCEESPARTVRYPDDVMYGRAGRSEVYPIRLWNTYHVWQFIEDQSLPYCSLYDEGFDRLGCVGCPLATEKQRRIEFDRWPGYERLWRDACRYVVEERAKRGLTAPPILF